jgi:hypothetical protein
MCLFLYYFPPSFCNSIHILTKALIPLSLELDRLRKPYYLCRVDHVRKIRDGMQRTDFGKYSFINRTIKNLNQLPAEALGTFTFSLVNLRFLETELGKQI